MTLTVALSHIISEGSRGPKPGSLIGPTLICPRVKRNDGDSQIFIKRSGKNKGQKDVEAQ